MEGRLKFAAEEFGRFVCCCLTKTIVMGNDCNFVNFSDAASVVARDKSMIGPPHVERARELLEVYEHAAELKKEKCYAFNNAEVEGKSLKELRYVYIIYQHRMNGELLWFSSYRYFSGV